MVCVCTRVNVHASMHACVCVGGGGVLMCKSKCKHTCVCVCVGGECVYVGKCTCKHTCACVCTHVTD